MLHHHRIKLSAKYGSILLLSSLSAQFDSAYALPSYQTLLLTGDAAPGVEGATFTNFGFGFGSATFNSAGQVAFTAEIEGPGISDFPGNTHGVWAGNLSNLALIAQENDSVPGVPSSTFDHFSRIRMHETGEVSFFATLDGRATASNPLTDFSSASALALRGLWV